MRRVIQVLLAWGIMMAGGRAFSAASYFVDFDGGSDANSGTATGTAWKHAPGDPAATGVAGAAKLAPGDTVKFKGGVDYKGNLMCRWSGESGAPITYSGIDTTWGRGRAIIDGSEKLSGWKPCASAEECGGNPNWANIWWTPAPAAVSSASANLTEDGKLLYLSEDPKQPDPFFMERVENFFTIPNKDMTRTSIVDPKVLTQTDEHYWDDASVVMWVTPNFIGVQKIKSFMPAEHKIAYGQTSEPYRDRNERYALFNSIHLIGRAGEYFYNDRAEADGRHKVYLWPVETGDLNQKAVTVSMRQNGFDIANNVSFVTIEGFQIELFSGTERNNGIGVRAVSNAGRVSGLVVRNNVISHIGHPFRGYGGVFINAGTDCLVEGNQILDNPGGIGILIGGGINVTLKNNLVRKPGSQAIWFMGCKDSQIVGNTVIDALGTHANGISVYSNSSNILVAGNRVINSNIPFTMEKSTHLTIACNIFDGANRNTVCTSWGEVQDVKVLNNLLIHSGDNIGLQFYKNRKDSGIVVKNNIIAGFPGADDKDWDVSNNLYLTRSASQKALRTGELFEEDLSKIFVAPERGDYHVRAGSPAIGGGVDVGLKTDMDGVALPAGKAPDIGPYEHAAAEK